MRSAHYALHLCLDVFPEGHVRLHHIFYIYIRPDSSICVTHEGGGVTYISVIMSM